MKAGPFTKTNALIRAFLVECHAAIDVDDWPVTRWIGSEHRRARRRNLLRRLCAALQQARSESRLLFCFVYPFLRELRARSFDISFPSPVLDRWQFTRTPFALLRRL